MRSFLQHIDLYQQYYGTVTVILVCIYLAAKPVLVDKSADIKDELGFAIFKIWFYSNPNPFQLKWFDNDQVLNGQIDAKHGFRETTLVIPVYGTQVNITGYSVFLQINHTLLSNSLVFQCHIENTLGFINVVFDELNTSEFDEDMYSSSTSKRNVQRTRKYVHLY